MSAPVNKTEAKSGHTFRRFKDGEHEWRSAQEKIFAGDETDKCPVYVHKTPPCQASCPSGEDIRGWLNIVRGVEKPPKDVTMQEYAFRRSTDANPFPSMMGRVCPAPCQTGCNRNKVEDTVGINAVEQYIGDTACPATACRARTWTARSTASSRWASSCGSTRASASTFS
jgi:glutamate synthase (NADPH/NADH) small chain